MIRYQYKALALNGKKASGVIEATDEYTAVLQIKENYPILLEIRPIKQKDGILSKEIGKTTINYKELSIMCSQFSTILRSGVPIDACISFAAKQNKDKKLKKMLEQSAEDVSRGNGVADSFEKNCKNLPKTFIETIRAGEESGTLERSFETLQFYYEKSFKTKQKVKQALSYPIFVLAVAVVVLIVVMVKVVPTLTRTFQDLDGELPLITKIMIASSKFFEKNFLWIGLILFVFVIGLVVYCNTEKGKRQWSNFRLKLPVLGKIEVLNTASQFANTMAALLAAGLSISRALEVTGKVLDNYIMGKEVLSMIEEVESGNRLSECMKKNKHFPDALSEMCAIGEETGELEGTFTTIGAYFDNEAQYATTKAIQRLEPTILIFMALFAGFIVLSIYLPMFMMYSLI